MTGTDGCAFLSGQAHSSWKEREDIFLSVRGMYLTEGASDTTTYSAVNRAHLEILAVIAAPIAIKAQNFICIVFVHE